MFILYVYIILYISYIYIYIYTYIYINESAQILSQRNTRKELFAKPLLRSNFRGAPRALPEQSLSRRVRTGGVCGHMSRRKAFLKGLRELCGRRRRVNPNKTKCYK